MSFEPFFDYDQINDEMAADIREAYVELRAAQDTLISSTDSQEILAAAKSLLEWQNEISIIARSINEEIFTLPAMVHVAGDVSAEEDVDFDNDDVSMIYVQRCERCGSNLHFADSEMDPYFEVGEQVGKIVMNQSMTKRIGETLYRIGDRDLEPHEFECVSLKNIFE
jgi:hypothetical protein